MKRNLDIISILCGGSISWAARFISMPLLARLGLCFLQGKEHRKHCFHRCMMIRRVQCNYLATLRTPKTSWRKR
jgi:hypothetical protein